MSSSSSLLSSSTPISTPTPTTRHTASQSLSPSHVSLNTPSPSPLLQTATSIPSLPPPSATTLSVLQHLQNLLDFTSTLLAIFIATVLTLLFLYWSTIYLLRKTMGIKPNSRIGIWDGVTDTRISNPSSSSSPDPKEKATSPSPSSPQDVRVDKKSKSVDFAEEQEQALPIPGLTSPSKAEQEKISRIAQSSNFEDLSKATGRDVDEIKADVDLELQRGVADVGGSVDGDGIEGVRGGSGRSYGGM
ncbi:hypothetical protein SBOR_5350 [Sclerotinia borealis F-4128]|uniref:Uncharacterized protein n=1 Tax=Sclerotinia borealis (strain F-4128) TaxID=1432307 RepID=W9CBY4_SCLBF|nr:hypothetical protein SBOR_5350 [Sclerotinia borealis F-4128]